MKQKVKSMKTAMGLYFSAEKKYNVNRAFKNRVLYTRGYIKNKIKDNVILYETMHGASMSGNPYAMFLTLLEMKNRKFIHVWVVKNEADFDKKGYEKYKNVKFVQRQSPKYMYYLTSAKYLINDVTFPPYFVKKEGQIYLNTWHGTPLKTLGKDSKGDRSLFQNAQLNFLKSDYLIAPNGYTGNILTSSHDLSGIYPGKIIEEGYPRMDLTWNTDRDTFVQDVLSKSMKIDPKKKIILYAPTWRGDTVATQNDTTADFSRIIKEMMKHVPKTHQLILKLHPVAYHFLANASELQKICVPEGMDTNELLAAVDILITDYSSIFFDFYITKKPIILFVYDYETYAAERGLYLNIEELDVDVAYTMETFVPLLAKVVKRKKEEDYQDAIQKYCYKNLDATTSKRYVDIMFNGNEADYNVYSIKNTKKNVIVYSGDMHDGAITNAFVKLTQVIDYNKFNIILIGKHKLTKDNMANFGKIHEKVKIIYRNPDLTFTIKEWIFYKYSIQKYNEKYLKKYNILELYQREFRRLFGEIEPDIVIDYEGYTPFWTQLFAYSKAKKKVIYLHHDMWKESQKLVNNRLPHRLNLDIIFKVYHKFDVLGCVEKATMEANKQHLQKFVAAHKFQYMPHSLSVPDILNKMKAFEYADVEILNHKYLVNVGREAQAISGFLAPSKDGTVFITIGELTAEKDHQKLIEAFKKLFAENQSYRTDVQLYIVGTGPLEDVLHKLVREAELSESIIFTGSLDNPLPLLKRSDCYVASANYEGSSTTILEALVLKKDIIATRIDGHSAVIADTYGTIVDNSIEGLYAGVVDYLRNKPKKKTLFDVEAYEKDMVQRFETACLSESKMDEVQKIV